MTDETKPLDQKIQLQNGTTLEIRLARPSDGAEMLAYLNRIGGESDFLTFGENGIDLPVEMEAQIIQENLDAPNTMMLLGLVEDEIIACAHLSPMGRNRIGHNGDLGISVRKDFWGCGVGTAMMNATISLTRSATTLTIIRLTVSVENERGLRLYERLGFQRTGTEPKFFCINGRYVDAVLLYLDLSEQK